MTGKLQIDGFNIEESTSVVKRPPLMLRDFFFFLIIILILIKIFTQTFFLLKESNKGVREII